MIFVRVKNIATHRHTPLAGIPDDLQLCDLRRTAATESASAGATPWELMAVGGWQNPNSMRPYLVRTPEQAASIQAKEKRSGQKADQCIMPGKTWKAFLLEPVFQLTKSSQQVI